MFGYHYTSDRCWKAIQKEGLKPYTIRKPPLRAFIGSESVKGIWLWQKRPVGLSHFGCVIYQMAMKNSTIAVLLRVSYELDWLLTPKDNQNAFVTLPHQGTIQNLEYHNYKDVGLICIKPIPKTRIKLVHSYDLLEAWSEEVQ